MRRCLETAGLTVGACARTSIVLLVWLPLALTSCASSGTTGSRAAAGGVEGSGADAAAKSIAEATRGLERREGLFDLWWNEDEGRLLMTVSRWDEPLLYVESLAAGVGSNDIGLDRGQLGDSHLVEFRRVGPRVLLVAPNLRYRAESDNRLERLAVQEAFAESVLWGFEVRAEDAEGSVLVDVTDFALRDAHGIVRRLAASDQGSYRIDTSRSAIFLDRTRAFPKNTEIEATLTYTGTPEGAWIRSVTPQPDAVTVRQHHSFVELPEEGYEPRVWDPRSGFIATAWYDYATPIDQPLVQRYAIRHRLEKVDATAELSDPVDPIVYYLDPGVPEPVRSALLDGAGWWTQAFEAAGYRDAFRVEMLPADADPMDLRYNLIQWVHRSTRGWSYGGSVVDPRTGEILKGKVTLGSLRVRQDFLIAEGLLAPYEDGTTIPPEMERMALARLRQLSAHEVGHTLGLVHNYTASVNERASVMDYPHPWIELAEDGSISLEEAYDTDIGEWDIEAIRWGYSDFADGADESTELDRILREARDRGLLFITDQDARPPGGAHPLAHLWDSGESAVVELERILDVRARALGRFGERNIRTGTPMSLLEETLVPIYLLHRYQVEAAAKVLGGRSYTYALRGDGQVPTEPVDPVEQRAALRALLRALSAETLTLPESLISLIPPPAAGLGRGRESFAGRTGVTIDPVAAAETAADMVASLLLHPERATRLVENHARDDAQPGLVEVLDELLAATLQAETPEGLAGEVKRAVDVRVLERLIGLALAEEASAQTRAVTLWRLERLAEQLDAVSLGRAAGDPRAEAHLRSAVLRIDALIDDPLELRPTAAPRIPDGSPIGSGDALTCGLR